MEKDSTRKRKADAVNFEANNQNVLDFKQKKLDEKDMKSEENNLEKKEEELFRKEKMLDKRSGELSKKEEEFVKYLQMKQKELDLKEQEFVDINRLKKLAQVVTDELECPVCLEIPRSGPVPVCPNGHLVCTKCKRASCPTCRTGMGDVNSLLALKILENIDHRCRFVGCEEKLSLEDIEEHERTCQHRTVLCPQQECNLEVSLSALVEHMMTSSCCAQQVEPRKALESWNTINFEISNIQDQSSTWSTQLFSYSDEVFAVFPNKAKGQFYFLFVLFNSEKDCSKFKFEAVVHEREKDVDNSDVMARFEGSPVSIEILKKELNLYCASDQLMEKILSKSTNKNQFRLSFKLTKK